MNESTSESKNRMQVISTREHFLVVPRAHTFIASKFDKDSGESQKILENVPIHFGSRLMTIQYPDFELDDIFLTDIVRIAVKAKTIVITFFSVWYQMSTWDSLKIQLVNNFLFLLLSHYIPVRLQGEDKSTTSDVTIELSSGESSAFTQGVLPRIRTANPVRHYFQK